MKTLVVYTSQTGFTKKYAEWLGERMKADVLDLKDAQKKNMGFFEDYQAIVYGGWAVAGKLSKSKWYLGKAPSWKDKKLAVFCVGGSPNESPETKVALDNMLNDEQKKFIKAFYCQGGINYEKMSAGNRLTLKMFVGALKKKKNLSEKERTMVEMISSTYDISDKKYIEPIVEYLEA